MLLVTHYLIPIGKKKSNIKHSKCKSWVYSLVSKAKQSEVLYLEEVNRYPFIPPNVDSATDMGITQENIPSSFSPKVCNNMTFLKIIPLKQGFIHSP